METFPHVTQVVCFEELPRCAAPQNNQERGEWQDFLKPFQFPPRKKENPERTEPMPWEDPQAFLASFEQVAKACQWPREEWAARLLPALSGEAEKSWSELETRDREDYGKVKAAILRGDAIKMEVQRQRFRQFRYQQAEDPEKMYSQLQELCHQWLQPERHSKEQILELLVLEQFLAILPQEIQNCMKGCGTKAGSSSSSSSSIQAVTVVEDFLSSRQEVKTWKSEFQEPVQEVAGSSLEAEEAPPSDSAQSHIYEEAAKQKGVGDLTLLAGEVMAPACSGALRDPPGGWGGADGDLTEGAVDLKGVAVPALEEAERTVLEPTQCPMYWEVLKEDCGNVDASGGVVIPKPNVFSAPGQEEIVFIQVSEDRETFPGSLSGDKAPNKPRELLPPQGRNELTEVDHTPQKVTNSKVAAIHGEGREAEGPEERETVQTQIESIKLSEGHLSLRETTNHMWVKKLLYSQGGRTCPSSQPGLVIQEMPRPGRKLYPCPICGKTFIRKDFLDDHQSVHTGSKLYDCPSCGKKFRWRKWVVEHQRIHTGEKPFTCSECGKSFRWRSGLRNHRDVHAEQSSYDPSCRKSYT